MVDVCNLNKNEGLFVPILMHGRKIMAWREKKRSSIRAVEMINLGCLLGTRGIDSMLNVRIRELCGIKNTMDEKINGCVLQRFGRIEKMKNSRTIKRIYKGKCV